MVVATHDGGVLVCARRAGAAPGGELPGGEVRGRQPLELYLKEVQLHPVSVRVSVRSGLGLERA